MRNSMKKIATCLYTWLIFYIFLIYDGLLNILHNFYIYRRRLAHLPADLCDKIVLITGASDGLGKLTAKHLAQFNITLILACRNIEKGEAVQKEILYDSQTKAKIHLFQMDVSSLCSVKSAVKAIIASFERIDVLINNAGIMKHPQSTSADGYEMHLATNHIGHFYLTTQLIPLLHRSNNPRIVTVSSSACILGKIDFNDLESKNNYVPLYAYANSKLANILFTRELSKRYPLINSYTLHPGMVRTNLFRTFPRYQQILIGITKHLVLLPPRYGIQTTLYCGFDERTRYESGHYYSNCRKVDFFVSPRIKPDDAEKLWTVTMQLCQEYL